MLSKQEQLAYIDAVKCLKSQPAQLGKLYDGVRSRFDDYQVTHINNTDYIHWVLFNSIFRWHRIFLAQYESDLRTICNYKGAQPYWDWSLDVNTETEFLNSPVFDPVYGFGGNGAYINTSSWTNVSHHIPGKTGGGCISTGPFKNLPVNMGPGLNFTYNPRCLTRDFSPWLVSQTLNSSVVNWALEAPNFYEFDRRVEGGVTVADATYHSGGHKGIGGDIGEISDLYSSPGEPLFYLHHCNVDRLWNLWQHFDWPNRKYDISGPNTSYAYPYDFFGPKPYHNITLDYSMDFQGLLATKGQIRTIGDAMDTQDNGLCYKYA
ncbi:Di-copper centre-containing protein [Trichoderma evansii]